MAQSNWSDGAVLHITLNRLAVTGGRLNAADALAIGLVHAPEQLDTALAAVAFSRAVQGPEGLAGTMAFLPRRKPTWAMP